MVTKDSPNSTPTPPEVQAPSLSPIDAAGDDQAGFFGLLVKSVFEPGANAAVVMAMNTCFFLLILTLFGLAFLTNWNKHVFLLIGVTTLLWASMIWFVMQVTKLQTRPDNMPPTELDLQPDSQPTASKPAGKEGQLSSETKKDR